MTLQKRKPAARVPRMLGYALAAAVVAAVLAGCTSAGTPQTPATIETPAGIEAAPAVETLAVEAPETEAPAVEDPAVEVPETDSASGNRPTPAGANRPDTSRTTTPAPGEESGCMPVESYEGKAEPDLQLATDPETAGVLRQMAECLSDVELMHLMVLPGLQAEAEMAEEDADCLAHSSSGRMFRMDPRKQRGRSEALRGNLLHRHGGTGAERRAVRQPGDHGGIENQGDGAEAAQVHRVNPRGSRGAA